MWFRQIRTQIRALACTQIRAQGRAKARTQSRAQSPSLRPMRGVAHLTALLAAGVLGQSASAKTELTPFATNVATHVLYHELAHALIREFDLPVLANEEAMADAFATVAVTTWHRDRASAIITDRVRSWIYEDAEVTPEDYDFKGEHLLDIRRAYQAGCLFYGLDPAEFAGHVTFLELSERDLSDCSDTGPDQQLGWERTLAPHMLPDGTRSGLVEAIFGEGPMKDAVAQSGLIQTFAADVARFDWPAPITLHFDHCDRGAYWSRSTRTITLCDDYVQRFITQGRALAAAAGQ